MVSPPHRTGGGGVPDGEYAVLRNIVYESGGEVGFSVGMRRVTGLKPWGTVCGVGVGKEPQNAGGMFSRGSEGRVRAVVQSAFLLRFVLLGEGEERRVDSDHESDRGTALLFLLLLFFFFFHKGGKGDG